MNDQNIFLKPQIVQKSWGNETIIHNDQKYCGKILFLKKGECISLQFHKLKQETFFLMEGSLLCKFCTEETFSKAEDIEVVQMRAGDVVEIPVGFIHQVLAQEDSKIIEISTQHFDDDTYRICKDFKIKVEND